MAAILENRLMSVVERLLYISNLFTGSMWLKAIRRGFIALFPFILFGSLALVFTQFPIPSYQQFMLNKFGQNWKIFGDLLTNLTFGLFGLLLSSAIGYFIACFRAEKHPIINPARVSLVSMLSFVIIAVDLEFHPFQEWLSVNALNQSNIFLAIMTAIIASELFIWLRVCLKKASRKQNNNPDIDLQESFEVFIPIAVTLLFFVLFRALMTQLQITNINEFISGALTTFFRNIEIPFVTALLFTALSQTLWFFGLHGNNILYPIINGLFTDNLNENIAASLNGAPLPHIITTPFMDSYTMMGGSGATMCLLIALFLGFRKHHSLKLAKISLLPSLFNVNELLTFGLPIVLNPLFLIPFICVPVSHLIIAYIATDIGFLPRISTSVQWTVPIFISGYHATHSWVGILIQAINLVLGTALYFPFVRLHQNKIEKDFLSDYNALLKLVATQNPNEKLRLLTRNDSLGQIARSLEENLASALKKNKIFLVYQPLVNEQGKVTSVESLARWKHPRFGLISPQLFISIAEEANLIDDLGLQTMEMAAQQLAQWRLMGYVDLRISVNLSPQQLKNRRLPVKFSEIVCRQALAPENFDLEITEGLELGTDSVTSDNIKDLSESGFHFSIDDFGMGHTSLLYIRHYQFSKVKIDGSLIRNIDREKDCQDIVAALVFLAMSQDFTVVAEFIERQQQHEILRKLGCHEYQGYLISKPLSPEECQSFFREHGISHQEKISSLS